MKNKNQRTGKSRPDRKQSRLMKQHPQLRAPARNRTLWSLPGFDRKPIEIIVDGDHHQAESGNNLQRQMNQSREDNHRKTDHKYYLEEEEKLRIDIKECRGPYDRYFQDNQPDTSGYQKTREVALTLATSELQISTRTRKENKHRRAVMRNPASQKKPRRRL